MVALSTLTGGVGLGSDPQGRFHQVPPLPEHGCSAQQSELSQIGGSTPNGQNAPVQSSPTSRQTMESRSFEDGMAPFSKPGGAVTLTRTSRSHTEQ